MNNHNLQNPQKQPSTTSAATSAAFSISRQKQDSPYHDQKIRTQIAAQKAAQAAAAASPATDSSSAATIASSGPESVARVVDRLNEPVSCTPLGKDTNFPSGVSLSQISGNGKNQQRAAAMSGGSDQGDPNHCADCGLKRHYFKLQDIAAKLLPYERVAHCFRHVNPRTNPDQLVDLVYTPPDEPGRLGRGSFGGLQVCGSIWHCPVCAARITTARRKEVEKIIAAGYVVFMVSLTVRHHRGDNLHNLRQLINYAWGRYFKGGRWWQDFASEYGVLGTIKAHELTWTEENGFHPHLHILFVCKRGQVIKHEDVSEDVKPRWIDGVQRWGGDADWEHGAIVTTSKNDGSDLLDQYFCKWGLEHEIARGPEKEGRRKSYSMNDLLELAGSGQQWAADLWLAYAIEYKGEQQLRWSNGLEWILGIKRKEDAEIIEEAENAPDRQVVTRLPYHDFVIILKWQLRDELKARIALTAGDADLLWEWLNSQGIRKRELVHIDLRGL